MSIRLYCAPRTGAGHMRWLLEGLPVLQGYADRLAARPGHQRAQIEP